MRILLLANVTPWPPTSGVSQRILHMAERVAATHDVTIGCHTWDADDREAVATLNRRGLRTVGGDVWAGSFRRHGWRALTRAARGVPPETAQYEAPALHALVRAGQYDVLQIEESILAPYLSSMPAGHRAQTLLTMHNVHFVQDRRMAEIEPHGSRRALKRFNAAWMRSYEPRVAMQFSDVITVSDTDRQLIQEAAPTARVSVIPNGVDTKRRVPLPPPDGPPRVLFIGTMSYRPCVDAAVWLVREIAPLVWRDVPDLQIDIVGRNPVDEVRALAGPRVTITGAVDEVEPSYRAATLAVVPLRAGGGTRLKILEAMALGRTVVSTTIGAEGIAGTDGVHFTLADTSADFARAVVTLLHDAPRRAAMVRDARALVESTYDWDILAARQLALYERAEGAHA